ncbi:MAG TPA: hypothetical protein VNI01_02270, partial [Elusimicrobiota bacterium]|nr:hypothetical protein [Elusimicrobiota bacterium]
RRGMKPIVQGKSMEQLRFTSKQSQNAATQNASEGQSSGSSRAFEGLGFTNGKTPGEGSVRNGSSDANPGSDPSEGGPILGQNPKEAASVPSTGSSSDKSPWTTALMMGVALLGTASVIITLEGMLVQAGNKNLILKSKLQPMAMALAAMAAALAASAAGIGAMIMAKYGQMQQGLALTIGGSITTAAAIASLLVPSQFAAMTMVIGGISGLVASMAAMITGMTGNKV